jgi:flagellar biosynthetic protein FliR
LLCWKITNGFFGCYNPWPRSSYGGRLNRWALAIGYSCGWCSDWANTGSNIGARNDSKLHTEIDYSRLASFSDRELADKCFSRTFSKSTNEYSNLFAMINILASEIANYFYAFLLPFVRISAFTLAAPIFSLNAFNVRFRIIIATALTVLAVDLIEFNAELLSIDRLIALVLVQLFLGLISGFILQVINGAITVAGQAISNAMGLGMANLIDPTLGNVPVISQFLVILSTLIFIMADGHLVLIQILMQSFSIFPVDETFSLNIIYELFIEWTPLLFTGGLLLALPIIISVLLVNAGLGMITRSAPALNIISVGFPAIMMAGIIILILVLPGIVLRIDSFWRDGFSMLVNLFERL